MLRPSAIRDRADPRDAVLLRQHLEHAVAERLVVVDEDVNGLGRIAHRRLALRLYLLRLPLHPRGEQALAAPNRRITVCTVTPARRATSSREIWSVCSSQKTSVAASRIRSAVAAAASALATMVYGRLASTLMLMTLT